MTSSPPHPRAVPRRAAHPLALGVSPPPTCQGSPRFWAVCRSPSLLWRGCSWPWLIGPSNRVYRLREGCVSGAAPQFGGFGAAPLCFGQRQCCWPSRRPPGQFALGPAAVPCSLTWSEHAPHFPCCFSPPLDGFAHSFPCSRQRACTRAHGPGPAGEHACACQRARMRARGPAPAGEHACACRRARMRAHGPGPRRRARAHAASPPLTVLLEVRV